jgi:interleukin-1 receptor-associated kinase 4
MWRSRYYGKCRGYALIQTCTATRFLSPQGDSGAERLAGEQFETEVNVLTKFRHPNLVTLIGYSSFPSKPKCLIYEFLPNGTLEEALEIGLGGGASLNAKTGSVRLPWMCRLSIACDTARGLAYLHTADRSQPLVHRDVKSANVLLDLSFRAKVGDFGLARNIQQAEETRTARVVGTSGYIPPEYYRGVITTKMDAFGFGVILLELISGLPSFDPLRNPKDLITYMEKDMDTDIPQILCTKIDEHAGAWPSESFVSLFRTARKCVEPKMHSRPEVHEVYPELEQLVTMSARLYAKQQRYQKTRIQTHHH